MWFWDLLGNILGYGIAIILAIFLWLIVLGFFIENASRSGKFFRIFWIFVAVVYVIYTLGFFVVELVHWKFR